MNDSLKTDLKKQEATHKKRLLQFKIAKWVETFGIRAFRLFVRKSDDTDMIPFVILFGLIRFVIHLIPALLIFVIEIVLLRIERGILWNLLAVYVIFYLIVWRVGKLLRQKFENDLMALEYECNGKRAQFFQQLCIEKNITRGKFYDEIVFDNGIALQSDGIVRADAPEQNVSFRIFNLKNYKDSEDRNSLSPYEQTMEKNIASTDFNQKFVVAVIKGNERECIKYFSPSRQLQMIKSTVLSQCHHISIEEKKFRATIDFEIERPHAIDIFSFESVLKNFESVEKYCEEFSNKANEVYADLIEIKL